MFFNVNISSIKQFEDLGWKRSFGSDDWIFPSSMTSETYLHMVCEPSSKAIQIKSITLRVNGQLVGKIFDDTGGSETVNLMDARGLGARVADEFRRAIKPLF